METGIENLSDDVTTLKNMVVEQARRIHTIKQDFTTIEQTLTNEVSQLKLQLLEAKEKYAALQRRFFGSSSEKNVKGNPKQELLFNEAETFAEPVGTKAPSVAAAHERKKTGRKPFPATLERHEIIHELSIEERTCPSCGALRPEIGDDRSEELRLIPAQAVVDVHIMKKYGPCPCKACMGTESTPIIQAPGPAKIVPGSRFSNGTIAFFLTSKFVDAQPFYRMEGILSRWGVDTGRATLCNLAIRAGRAIGELVLAIKEDIKASPVIGMDETSVQVLHETNRTAQSLSYMWVSRGFRQNKPLLLFHYHPSHAKDVATGFLSGFSGYLQTDGYAAYNESGKSPGIVHVGCLAHVRRKFYDAAKIAGNGSMAHAFLTMITELYQAETLLRERYERGELDGPSFIAERKKEQGPRLNAMKAWLLFMVGTVPPSLALGTSISYALGQWDRVVHYLDHERLTPDNNAVENAIRPFVVGRKNWLFSNTPLGAHASAGLYSLIETAKANGHEPYKYLCYLFDELPKATTLNEKLRLLPYHLNPSSY